MFVETGFSFTYKGANSGALAPMPSFSGMFNNDKYNKCLSTIEKKEDLILLKQELHERAYQSYDIDVDKMFNNFMIHSIINNLEKLHVDFERQHVLSNSNTIYSFYPVISEYPELEQEKVKKYKLEQQILKFINDFIQNIQIDNDSLFELFFELFIVVKNKVKKNQSQNQLCQKIFEIRTELINNKEFQDIYSQYSSDKIFINVNKQGSDGRNNIFYQKPLYLSEASRKSRDEFKIENFKMKLPAIMETSVASVHPVFLKKFEKLIKLSSVDVFKLVNWYKNILRNFDVGKNVPLEHVLSNIVKLSEIDGKTEITVKNINKEILMKTEWYNVGKQISLGVYLMHATKEKIKQRDAISSSKEELVNSLKMKRSEQRSDLIINKYLVKFSVELRDIQNPESLLIMDDVGLKEFILGLYIQNNNKKGE